MNKQNKIWNIYKKIQNIIKPNYKFQNKHKMKYEKKWDN